MIDDEEIVFAFLPTRSDHVPDKYLQHGCVNIEQAQLSCYIFFKNEIITTNNFSFDFNTFVYFYNVQRFNRSSLLETYPIEEKYYEVIGELTDKEKKKLIV